MEHTLKTTLSPAMSHKNVGLKKIIEIFNEAQQRELPMRITFYKISHNAMDYKMRTQFFNNYDKALGTMSMTEFAEPKFRRKSVEETFDLVSNELLVTRDVFALNTVKAWNHFEETTYKLLRIIDSGDDIDEIDLTQETGFDHASLLLTNINSIILEGIEYVK